MRYLQDYASELDINVRYNTEICEIDKEDGKFALTDQTGEVHTCSVLIVRLGLRVAVCFAEYSAAQFHTLKLSGLCSS